MIANRRSFLLGIGAALAAPAVVRAESLMKLWVPPAPEFTPNLWLINHSKTVLMIYGNTAFHEFFDIERAVRDVTGLDRLVA